MGTGGASRVPGDGATSALDRAEDMSDPRGRVKGAGGSACESRRRVLVTVVAIVAAAASAQRASAQEEIGGWARLRAEGWRLETFEVNFADDYLGYPKNGLNDDNGFVANLRLAATLSDGDRGMLRLEVSQQLITQRGGLSRVDEGRVGATYSRTFARLDRLAFTFGLGAGLEVVGNLGGSQLQDWAHHDLWPGRHLEGVGGMQLQNGYPSRTDVVPLVGGSLRVDRALVGPVAVGAGFEGVGGVGTGSFGELHAFVAVRVATRSVQLELREGGAIYGTNIQPLTMPGGYVTGRFQSDPSAWLTVLGPRAFPAFLVLGIDWNRGDTGQHVGQIGVGMRF